MKYRIVTNYLLLFTSLCIFTSCQAIEEDSIVQVFDNVLDEETVNWLHDEAIAMESTEDDISFEFPLETPSKHSSMEQMLNQILLELYPNFCI